MATLIAGLEIEFGRGAGEGLAQHFLDAEDADFRWDARDSERWLGSYESGDEDADEVKPASGISHSKRGQAHSAFLK